jgi:multidrug efflux pump subunit AcrA (membrane-fusion protein)
MSETVPDGRMIDAEEPGDRAPAIESPRRRRRRRWVVVGPLVILVAGGLAAAWAGGVFQPNNASTGNTGAPPPATSTVVREDITQTTQENATLGYAGTYTVTGKGNGTLTWLPSPGQVIRQGQALYRVDNGSPVVLLYGSVPAWENMAEGTTGEDVTQLNHDLVDLGYASKTDIEDAGWDYYSWETSAAVQTLEKRLGVSAPAGSLPLGSVVFEPQALRISTVPGILGGPAAMQIIAATSDQHQVQVNLSTSMTSEVAEGDKVSITLPDGSGTPGVITSVGSVATGSAGSETIPVLVKLTDPAAAGTLDQAAVTVNIATTSAPNALVVPVGALLAQPSGGYAVEVVGPRNTRRLVPVTVGLFDDADGLVQVTGDLTPGEHLVVPST